jgi:hypothetical protein
MKKAFIVLTAVILTLSLVSTYALASETELVSEGKSYVVNGIYTDDSGIASYPDENGDSLTNGIFADSASYGDPEFVGLNATSAYGKENNTITDVTVDLESVYPVTTVNVSCSNLGSAGIAMPYAVSVSVSEDGENWSDSIYAEYEVDEPVAGEVIKAIATINANARYVKYSFEHDTNWVFIDEVQVFAGEFESTDTESDTETENSAEADASLPENSSTEQSKAEAESNVSVNNSSSDTNNSGKDNTWIYITCAVASVAVFFVVFFTVKKK